MTKLSDPTDPAPAMIDRFGTLSLRMLNDTSLSAAWRINFLANFFTGPIYRDLATKFDLSRPGFVILFSLSHEPGLVARDIVLVTGQPKNSISRAVSELLSRGLIRRETDSGDRRAKVLTLTPAGQDLLNQVVPLFEVRQTAMFDALTPEEDEIFFQLLMKVIYAMPEWVEND